MKTTKKSTKLIIMLLALLLTPILFTTNKSYALEATTSSIGLSAQDTGSHTDPNVTIQSPSGGGMAVGIHTLVGINAGVDTTYNLTLAAKTNSTDLLPGTSGSTGTGSTNDTKLTTTTGTIDNPKVLGNNEWGFAIPDKENSKFSTPANYNSTDQSILSTTTWAGLPTNTNPVNILNKEVKAGTLLNENIYYGANAAKLIKAGSYSTSVVYTLTATVPAPTIATISPNTYAIGTPDANASKITITGSNLRTTNQVYIDLNKDGQIQDNEKCTDITTSNTQAVCVIPTDSSIALGFYDLYLTTEGGTIKQAKGIEYKKYAKPIDPDKVGSICTNADDNSSCKVDIDANMIPIKYTGNTTTPNWTKADTTKTGDWYNYQDKQWANAVTVKKDKLDTYKNATPGTDIPEADILGYYVYIPRYAYEVMRRDAKDEVVQDRNFNIKFESKDTVSKSPKACSKSGADYRTCIGANNSGDKGYDLAETNGNENNTTWATHPAFNFGGVELNGIWFGKFEVTGTPKAPTIKPGLAYMNIDENEWNSGGIDGYYDVANSLGLKDSDVSTLTSVAGSQNTNNLSKFSSHMVKNTEWGAVAYLSASEFGFGIDNVKYSRDFANTGMGANGGSYNTDDGRASSTTGTVYGVYGMTGGAWEYAAGSIDSEDGYLADTLIDKSKVPSKMFNLYKSSVFDGDQYSNYSKCTWETCGGQALHETLKQQVVSSAGSAWGGGVTFFGSCTLRSRVSVFGNGDDSGGNDCRANFAYGTRVVLPAE